MVSAVAPVVQRLDKTIHQAPVVQRLDNAFHRINRYPVDKYYYYDKCGQNKLRCSLDLFGGYLYQPITSLLAKPC